MEKRLLKEKKEHPKLGSNACRLLRLTLPFVVVQSLCMLALVFGKDTYELSTEFSMLSDIFEKIGASFMMAVAGSLLFDVMEKREKRKN